MALWIIIGIAVALMYLVAVGSSQASKLRDSHFWDSPETDKYKYPRYKSKQY